MARKQKQAKKTIRLQVAKQLEKDFSELRSLLGESKFSRNVKKATKALTANLKKSRLKDEPVQQARKPGNIAATPEAHEPVQ
jgi:hypothetical protein